MPRCLNVKSSTTLNYPYFRDCYCLSCLMASICLCQGQRCNLRGLPSTPVSQSLDSHCLDTLNRKANENM